MWNRQAYCAGLLAACMFSGASEAQVLMQRDVSLRMALTIAMTASEQCGAIASVAVVDRAGRIKVLMQGDDGSPHNLELARRKAYTARTFRSPSAAWAKRTETTNQGQRMLADVIPLGGGMPIMVGEETIGGIGLERRARRPAQGGGLRAGRDREGRRPAQVTTGSRATQMIRLRVHAVAISVTITTAKITSSTSPA